VHRIKFYKESSRTFMQLIRRVWSFASQETSIYCQHPDWVATSPTPACCGNTTIRRTDITVSKQRKVLDRALTDKL
jgi:hypothetical protein